MTAWKGQDAAGCFGGETGCPEASGAQNHRLDDAQMEMEHLVRSIRGGVVRYQIEAGRFRPVFFSDEVAALSGHTREVYARLVEKDAWDMVYAPDQERVRAAAADALQTGEVLDISFRVRNQNGALVWLHLNGRRMGPLSQSPRFYAVLTGMSPEASLFQSIANETADAIYVIDKRNYDLLYANESEGLFKPQGHYLGEKCFAALRGKPSPCAFCLLGKDVSQGEEREIVDGKEHVYHVRLREMDWHGIPAYIKYVRDITAEADTRREKERLEMYFRTLVESLPGGISVIRLDANGSPAPEFISKGLAAMLKTSVEEAVKLHEKNIFTSMHPEDVPENRKKLQRFIEQGRGHCEMTARMRQADGGYLWVKCTLSMLHATDGVRRLYCVYADISKTVEEKELLRRQYEEQILQHYGTPDPNTLVLGHCNITKNKILEIWDSTGSDLLKTFGDVRETFFTGLSGLVVDPAEREKFRSLYLNAPALAAFARKETEQILTCFIKLPREQQGRHVQFKVNLVETPDTGDVTGILTVTDVTDQTISKRILHQLSVTSHDYVVDLALDRDFYTVLTVKQGASCVPASSGGHAARVAFMADNVVTPKDAGRYRAALAATEIRRRLQDGPYTFAYSVFDENKDIRIKNMTVSAIDLRIGRVCLVCTDITGSVREQQGLLNMMAYTFEQMGFLDVASGGFTVYTRRMVLENLPPDFTSDYRAAVRRFTGGDHLAQEETRALFQIDTLCKRLEAEPSGYDFVFPCRTADGLRYKQVNVLWGDQNRRTICMVRADVTETLASERRAKKALEKALALSQEASQAKSDFLSTMSHDIRTPMNAIIGMTTLAAAHLDERERIADCLEKISISSKHLLSLINDVLDMNRIERSKITLSHLQLSLTETMEQLAAIMEPQARAEGLEFLMRCPPAEHTAFYGDALRINQILLNLLSNAVKFTPSGGRVEFTATEIAPLRDPAHVRYCFSVRDTGIGMPKSFLRDIFAPFARDGNASRIEGTGLGLSITKGLVDLMEGAISVESREGEGSIFRVELEFEAAQADPSGRTEQTAADAVDQRVFAGRQFLVVEDNEINAEILCELLAMRQATVVVKTNGAQAVQAFTAAAPETYDAILMDIQMPEMNGYEATKRIRAFNRPDARRIPILAMTANAFAEDIQAALDAGMTAHVAKPIDMEILREALRKAFLGNENAHDAAER